MIYLLFLHFVLIRQSHAHDRNKTLYNVENTFEIFSRLALCWQRTTITRNYGFWMYLICVNIPIVKAEIFSCFQVNRLKNHIIMWFYLCLPKCIGKGNNEQCSLSWYIHYSTMNPKFNNDFNDWSRLKSLNIGVKKHQPCLISKI